MPTPRRSLLLVASTVLVAASVFAQTKGRPARTAPRPRAHPAAPPPSKPVANLPTSEVDAGIAPMTGRGEAKTAAPKESLLGAGDAGVKIVDRDGGTKQFKFGETDIEGRLKAPQLVYFLRRVRAEFAAGDLGHRSFLRELSETQRDPNF